MSYSWPDPRGSSSSSVASTYFADDASEGEPLQLPCWRAALTIKYAYMHKIMECVHAWNAGQNKTNTREGGWGGPCSSCMLMSVFIMQCFAPKQVG